MRRPLSSPSFRLAPAALAALLALGALPAAAGPAPARLSFDEIFDRRASGVLPGDLQWTPGGGRLLYTWDEKGDGSGKALFRLDPAAGKTETLLRWADLKGKGKGPGKEPGTKADLVPGRVIPSPKGDDLLFQAEGDLFLYRPADQSLKALTQTEAEEETPSFSPDGSRVAFVRAWNLYVLDLAGGEERAMTSDGKENAILNGINDWVYEEEIWNRNPEAYWWSPDSRKIAFLRFDEAEVGSYPLLDSEPLYPKVTWQKYPKAGEPNPKVKVGVATVANAAVTWLDPIGTEPAGDPESYLTRIAWGAGASTLVLQRLNRDQTQLDLLRCDVSGGDCAPLLSESRKTWLNLGDDFRLLPDGRMIWGSEREGQRRLYLYGADGNLIRPLTPASWSIASLDAVAEDGSWIAVTGFEARELEPIHRKVARAGLAKESWEVLTPEPGAHREVVDPKTGAWVHTASTADLPPRTELRRASVGPLSLPSAPPRFDPKSLPSWEFVTVPGPNGLRFPARLLKPAGFDPAGKYPVLMYHYGGPGSQVVDNNWSARVLWQKAMAQRGFALFSLDNASSVFFGKEGEDRDHRRFGTVNLEGQLAGVEYLKTLPWVDAGRLGLWGWSGGGTNTLYCILNAPGVWRAAVAGAPVTDWRLYDTIWTERYLDTPQNNPDGYRDSSPITYAGKLADKLLLVHGFADDNVHPQNSVNLADAFVKAGKPFEEAFYPKQKHGFVPLYSRHFYERMTEFFERTLQGVEVEDVNVVEPKK